MEKNIVSSGGSHCSVITLSGIILWQWIETSTCITEIETTKRITQTETATSTAESKSATFITDYQYKKTHDI